MTRSGEALGDVIEGSAGGWGSVTVQRPGDVDGRDSAVHDMLVLASGQKFGIRFESPEIAYAANVGEFVMPVEAKDGW
jgi:hypothetical protein